MAGQNKPTQRSAILLVVISFIAIWSSPAELATKVIMSTGVVFTMIRRYLLRPTQVYLILGSEILVYLVLAMTLPGIWSVMLIISLMFRFGSMYVPTQIRPRLLYQQHLSPYLGTAIAACKALLAMAGLDISSVPAEMITGWLSGLIALFFCITILSYHIYNRARMYEELLKDMAVKEKNWTLELLSLLTHNIRTPITTMSNRIEIMRMKSETGSEISLNDITSLQQSNENVSKIINQLLNNTARTQIRDKQGVISLESALEMLDLTDVVLENLGGVDFNLSSTNAIALQLCLESLLSNAFKYGGTDVRLTIVSGKLDFRISVKDNGQGMSAKQIESYGTPFNHSQTSGGTGLGVYFTLQLIKEKGWDWSLESTEGEGTKATLIIPRSKLLI